jgi:hypothetical protein
MSGEFQWGQENAAAVVPLDSAERVAEPEREPRLTLPAPCIKATRTDTAKALRNGA